MYKINIIILCYFCYFIKFVCILNFKFISPPLICIFMAKYTVLILEHQISDLNNLPYYQAYLVYLNYRINITRTPLHYIN